MIILDLEQRSKEWHLARRGVITASNFHKLAGARGLGKTGETYIYSLVASYLGVDQEPIGGQAIQWGVDLEPDAREYFQLASKQEVEEIGFIKHDTLNAGISPDGVIRIPDTLQSKGIEIKCPYNPLNHVKHMTIKTNEDFKRVNDQYYWQVMFSLWVTGFDAWHFVSYDPRFTGKQRMHIATIKPDKEAFYLIESRVIEATKLMNDIIEKVK